MARVLLTGATGFVGRHAIATLLARGHAVHTVGSRTPGSLPEGVTHHVANLLDVTDIERVTADAKADKLLHFAWYVKPGEYLQSYENVRWVTASLELLRAFREHGGTRAVMAGTCFEYDLQRGFLTEDVTPARPDSLYGTSKESLRQLVAGVAGDDTAWGRIFFLYGPHEYPGRLVASVINALLRGEPAKCSHGRQVRDFLHVQDVADAFVALLDSGVTGTVNIASGEPVTIAALATSIATQLGRSDGVLLGALPSPENEPPVILGDTRRLQQEVGWTPAYTLEDGLAQTIEWWKTQVQTDAQTRMQQ